MVQNATSLTTPRTVLLSKALTLEYLCPRARQVFSDTQGVDVLLVIFVLELYQLGGGSGGKRCRQSDSSCYCR